MPKIPHAFAKTLWVIAGREGEGRFLCVNAWHAANLAWLKGVRPAPAEVEMRHWRGRDPLAQVYELEPLDCSYQSVTDRKVYISRPNATVQMALPFDRAKPLV